MNTETRPKLDNHCESVIRVVSFSEFLSINENTPFLLLKKKDFLDKDHYFKIYAGNQPQNFTEEKDQVNFFGALSFEGEQNFLKIENVYQLDNLKSNIFFKSEDLKLCSVNPVESFDLFEKMINMSKTAFSRNKKLLKIVLHRKIKITFNRALVLDDLLSFIPELTDNQHFFIYYDGNEVHLSLTPETLVELNKTTIKTMALAGTAPRGNDSTADKKLESGLLNDVKNLKEQDLVAQNIMATLENFCTELSISQKNIVKLSHVQHLINSITGIIKSPLLLPQILKELHPTPALGGEPKTLAKQTIREIEGAPRNLYGAAIGIKEYDHAEFLVNIRNFSFIPGENSLYIYGGAGILPESSAASEWEETENKMRTFLNFFSKNKEDNNE